MNFLGLISCNVVEEHNIYYLSASFDELAELKGDSKIYSSFSFLWVWLKAMRSFDFKIFEFCKEMMYHDLNRTFLDVR